MSQKLFTENLLSKKIKKAKNLKYKLKKRTVTTGMSMTIDNEIFEVNFPDLIFKLIIEIIHTCIHTYIHLCHWSNG